MKEWGHVVQKGESNSLESGKSSVFSFKNLLHMKSCFLYLPFSHSAELETAWEVREDTTGDLPQDSALLITISPQNLHK